MTSTIDDVAVAPPGIDMSKVEALTRPMSASGAVATKKMRCCTMKSRIGPVISSKHPPIVLVWGRWGVVGRNVG